MKASCKSVERRLVNLRNQGKLLLDGCKLDDIVDFIAPAPRTKNNAYSKKNNKIDLLRFGILSSKNEPCSDL
jgi:hypothetical protein